MTRRRRNTLFLVLGLAAVITLGIFGAFRPKAQAIAVREYVVRNGPFSSTLPETGVLQRASTQVLPALVGGNIETLNVRAGDSLKAGDVVATIVNPQVDSALATAESAYAAAAARARSAAETNAVLPAQNRSSIVQAQANLESAKVSLQQARQDVAAGQQSGLGYTGTTAEEQRVQADATLAKADTDLHEAQRVYDANRDLFTQRAISKDALDQSLARLQQAKVADDQARRERDILSGQLSREHQILIDRVHAAEDAQRQAQAALDAAQSNAAHSKSADVQAAQGDADRAAADLRYARDQVARLVIRSPMDGVVETIASEQTDPLRPLQPGDAVQPGQAIVTIAGRGGFVVRTKVDEQDIAAVRVGQHARISGEDFGGRSVPGHVAFISDVAQKSDDPSNTSREVITTVALDRTLPFLRDGMTVDVDITTTQIRRAVVIPNEAIARDARDKPSVFVVRDGVVKKVPIALGIAGDTTTVVRRGLRSGDIVVAEKNDALKDGVAVRPQPSPSPAGG
ncbi:MAG: efflux RND transporter periplasmic adaptor subunit [Candidatus Eremiobacteraeota bacterium]|nr:efflux RND transporter periplasmic adaptor subunit [Candidatus Eremiobacteraeota bacterium]